MSLKTYEQSKFCPHCRGYLSIPEESVLGHHLDCKEMMDTFIADSDFVIKDLMRYLPTHRIIPPFDLTNYIRLNKKGQIVEVNLRNRDIFQVPESLQYCPALRELYLRENNLQDLPQWLFDLKHLEVLDLYGNNFFTLDERISDLPKLRLLNLEVNWLTELPSSIGDFQSLVRLIVSANDLVTLPEALASMSKLRTLECMNMCSGFFLPEWFGSGHKHELTRLELNVSGLTTLPDSITNLQSLRVLDLGHNLLQNLPSNFGNLSNLTELYIQYNLELDFLPSSFYSLSQLKELAVTRCSFAKDNKVLDKIKLLNPDIKLYV